MKFADIIPYTRCAGYKVNVDLRYLPDHYLHYVQDYGLDVNPDFQRGNVWTVTQKARFVEHALRGGQSGRDIYLNCPEWNDLVETRSCVLVDGKQRLDAVLGFLDNEFPVFSGAYFRDFTDRLSLTGFTFNWHVNDLQTREEVLQWYLDLNSGGTVHTDDELTRVRGLLERKVPYVRPDATVLASEARLDRACIQEAVKHRAEQDAERAANAAKFSTEAKTTRGRKRR